MKINYKDSYGAYSITIHKDKTATVRHRYNDKDLFKKSYTSLENAKLALSRYCDGMPSVIKE